MTNTRWNVEVAKMKRVFPHFKPFARGGLVGFEGYLAGSRGREYTVTLEILSSNYPAYPPRILIDPWVGSNRTSDGSLCVSRQWRPDLDTFAQQVLYAAHYLNLYG